MHKIKNWLHFIKFLEKVDKIKWPYFFDLMHIWPCFGCLLLCPFLILKYFFLKKPSTDFFKNHLKSLFYIYFIIFHRKIQSDPPKNLVAAFRQCGAKKPRMRGTKKIKLLFLVEDKDTVTYTDKDTVTDTAGFQLLAKIFDFFFGPQS